MLRISARRTLLAAALLTGSCLGLSGTPWAGAQEPLDCPTCNQDGAICPQGGLSGGGLAGSMLAGRMAPNCRDRQYGSPELFYNYYVPGTCGGVPAQLYLAPRPVPAVVGHTYYTYQPFMPHELLYQHNRRYYRYYDNGRGMTRTRISWYNPPGANLLGSAVNYLRIPR